MGELMKLFFGTKLVAAKPMTLGAYNRYRGWTIPENEDPDRAGYLVEYIGAGDKNHAAHDNYISWSPDVTFDASHLQVGEYVTLKYLPHVQRLVAELAENQDRLKKLQKFQETERFQSLAEDEKADMIQQEQVMSMLDTVLCRRANRATAQADQELNQSNEGATK